MGPPHPISSTPNAVVNTPPRHQRQCSSDIRNPRSPSTKKEANLGMSPVSRYKHNLKVLRRRDPSIISIFDQFSHVCVYHYNGSKWEKQGFEGSMFLYERESYPPYGFYILNRMGMDDYIQCLYPEDDVSAHGSYLMLRSFPDFTSQRLADACVASPNSGQIPHKFSDVYVIQSPDKLSEHTKGRSQTVGLWMFATDAREPLIDVMLRLHSFIKKNLPYPEEFRYGPDRPPPPNPNPRNGSQSPSKDDQSRSSTLASPSSLDLHATSQLPSNLPTHTPSTLDLLLSRLDPASVVPLEPSKVSTPSLSSPTQPKMTVERLFGTLSGTETVSGYEIRKVPHAGHQVSPTSNRGLSLLDKIFASATPSPGSSPTNGIKQSSIQSVKVSTSSVGPSPLPTTHPAQTLLQHSTPSHRTHSLAESTALASSQSHCHQPISQHSQTFLLKPSFHSDSSRSNSEPILRHPSDFKGRRTLTGTPPPIVSQVLTQDVIFTLLGLGPDPSKLLNQNAHTRSSSTSTTSSRYSGDAEDEGDGGHADSDAYSGFSHPSTVFDTDADNYEEIPAAEIPEVQHVSRQRNGQAGAEVPVLLKVNGDVTPRAPWRRSSLCESSGLHDKVPEHTQKLGYTDKSSTTSGTNGMPTEPPSIPPPSTITPFAVNLSSSTDTVRSLGVNNVDLPLPSVITNLNPSRLSSGIDLLETSFPKADTELWPDSREPIDDRALDDDADIVELDFADTSALSDVDAFLSMIQEKEKKRKGLTDLRAVDSGQPPLQLGKEGRDRRYGSQRVDVEKSRNDAATNPVNSSSRAEANPKKSTLDTPLKSFSASSGPPDLSVHANSLENAQTNPSPNSKRSSHANPELVNGKHVAVNGRVAVKGQSVHIDRKAIQQSLLAVATPARLPTVSERNEFVREVLTLVHTDKNFVDDLWREYTTRMLR